MKPLIIGVAGGTASGKTTFTHKLIQHIGSKHIAIIPLDSYYKDNLTLHVKPDLVNFDHPDAFDWPLLIHHLHELHLGSSVNIPQYDFVTHRRVSQGTTTTPKKVILVEGILLFVNEQLRNLFDIKIFVDTESDERLLRRINRDLTQRGRSLASVMNQYRETVRPMHEEFVEPSKRWANIIVPYEGDNVVALELMATFITAHIRQYQEFEEAREVMHVTPATRCSEGGLV